MAKYIYCYRMARHGVVLDLPLSIIYLVEYSVPDCGIPKTFYPLSLNTGK